MAINRIRIEATPAEVFAVLVDAHNYVHWVVGADQIRAVDADWPHVGSRFHHTVGVGPFKLRDNTKVLEVEPYRRLVLEARARPAGVAAVTFTLSPVADTNGPNTVTEVAIHEEPIRGLAKAIHNPLQDVMIRARNAETLRRLRKQVYERRQGSETPPVTTS